jgi:hypothetical protein
MTVAIESLAEFQRALGVRLLGAPADDADDANAEAVGFAVHAHNVQASLRRAIEKAFPVTRDLVGSAFFAAMADRFIVEQPPTLGWLSAYGAGFADSIGAYSPAANLDYLGDVARVEWGCIHAGSVDAPALDLQALAAVPADELPSLRLRLHPAATLIASRYPALDIWRAHQEPDNEDQLARIDLLAGPQAVLVTRVEALRISAVAIDPGDAAFLKAIDDDLCFGDTCVAALDAEEDYDLSAGLRRLAHARSLGALAF